MATNTNERELELSEEVNDFLAILDTEGGDPNEHALKLQKLRDEMNNMGVRKSLNGLLETININLEIIGVCKTELTAGYLTISTAGDCMVRCVKKVFTLPGQLLYSETDATVQKTQAVSQYALDQLHLSNEPSLCYDLLSEIRDLILRCARLHTELFLAGKEYDQLLDNVQLFDISIPRFTLAGLLAECVRIEGFERRKVFEKIHQFRKKLGNHNIRAHLQTMCDKLETIKNILQSYFRDNSNGEIDLRDFNVIMKAYKDYRATFGKTRADPDNNDKSDEELHRLIRRFGAYNCIKPLMEKFEDLSIGDAWELLDGIHLMVVRE